MKRFALFVVGVIVVFSLLGCEEKTDPRAPAIAAITITRLGLTDTVVVTVRAVNQSDYADQLVCESWDSTSYHVFPIARVNSFFQVTFHDTLVYVRTGDYFTRKNCSQVYRGSSVPYEVYALSGGIWFSDPAKGHVTLPLSMYSE